MMESNSLNRKKLGACLTVAVVVVGAVLALGTFNNQASSPAVSQEKNSGSSSRYEIPPSQWHSPPNVNIGQGFGVQSADYIIFKGNEGNIYAKSGESGKIAFESSDFKDVFQSAESEIPSGGLIALAENTYKTSSVEEVNVNEGVSVAGHGSRLVGYRLDLENNTSIKNLTIDDEGYSTASVDIKGAVENVYLKSMKVVGCGPDFIHYAVGLTGCKNVVLDDVEITKAGHNAVSSTNTKNVTYRNCWFHNNWDDALDFNGDEEVRVVNNRFEDIQYIGCSLEENDGAPSHDFLICGNTFDNVGNSGGISFESSENVIVTNNIFRPREGIHCISGSEVINSTISNNIFVENAPKAIYAGMKSCRVTNNLFIAPKRENATTFIWLRGYSKNNIITCNTWKTEGGSGTKPITIRTENNATNNLFAQNEPYAEVSGDNLYKGRGETKAVFKSGPIFGENTEVQVKENLYVGGHKLYDGPYGRLRLGGDVRATSDLELEGTLKNPLGGEKVDITEPNGINLSGPTYADNVTADNVKINNFYDLDPLASAPAGAEAGTVVMSDGTNWDVDGDGYAELAIYNGSSWLVLENMETTY